MDHDEEAILAGANGGGHSVSVGEKTVAIRKKDGTYHITVREPKKRPLLWIYRNSSTAVDRFQEQVDFCERGQQTKKEA